MDNPGVQCIEEIEGAFELKFTPPEHGWRWLKTCVRAAANLLGAGGMTVATGGYARLVAPYAVEYPERPMPLRNLPESFEGFRIVQISDLHTGDSTPVAYLGAVVERVNAMRPDLICVTGDLVTHSMQWVTAACDVLAKLRAPVVVTFGNHDYAPTSQTWSSSAVADALEARLREREISVLRNEAMAIERADGRLWIVGLEDFWSGLFSPRKAFSGVPQDEPAIAMSHNPDTAFALARWPAQWILAGHTHGGQIRLPVVGSMILPVQCKRFDQGEFRVRGRRMYVTRGVGCRLWVRFRCPPEVPVFVLTRET